MSEERLLVEERDEYGVIRVIESGDYRFLEFGDGVEQSCVFMPDPAWLEYDYTRAMLLGGLCHSQPRRALFLGFGAGSLTQPACATCRWRRPRPSSCARRFRAWPASIWGCATTRACDCASATHWRAWANARRPT